MIPYPNIDPVALSLGPFVLRWYGLMFVIGFAVAWWLGRQRASKPDSGWNARDVDNLIVYCIVGLVVGGRVGYAIFYNFSYFLENPFNIFMIWHGGMSFHGGLLGVTAALWLFARSTGKRFFSVTDFLVPLAPLGLLVGRVGCFINGNLWGRPTTAPWGMVFPDPAAGGIPRHPSQLYEAFLEGLVLFLILWFYSAKARPRMAVSGLFLLGYGTFRFAVEFVRQPDVQLGFIALDWVTMGQILSLPMILAGAYLLARAYSGASENEVGSGPALSARGSGSTTL